MICPICRGTQAHLVFRQAAVPLFQNVVYRSRAEALAADKGAVELAACAHCGFVFNAAFQPEALHYNPQYQNEQAHSQVFVQHLEQVFELLQQHHIRQQRVVEVGCGKGFFIDFLRQRGVDAIGFDPAYEGDNPAIVKDYFSDRYPIQASFVVLRHTLEHVAEPLQFLHQIAQANGHRGKIYIEVPTFDWIVEHEAVEDIFYEHCNYFTIETLSNLFRTSHTGTLFGGQYIYLVAHLSELHRPEQIPAARNRGYQSVFDHVRQRYQQLAQASEHTAIWGAGAKGSTFLNLVDAQGQHIRLVVDINPRKQGHFVGGTGHAIVGPAELAEANIDTVLVMNANYLQEIEQVTKPLGIRLLTLDRATDWPSDTSPE